MVQLQVGGGVGGLVHGADDVGTLVVLDAEEAVEDVAEGGHVVQVVEDDGRGQLVGARVVALVSDVGQVLPQVLGRLVVNVERGHRARGQLAPRSGGKWFIFK